jgi:hypothetical protein
MVMQKLSSLRTSQLCRLRVVKAANVVLFLDPRHMDIMLDNALTWVRGPGISKRTQSRGF